MTTTQEGRRLKRQLAAQERGRGKRYDGALRERVVMFAKHRRSEGRSWAEIATELGVAFETVRRWCLGRRQARETALALRPVEVAAVHERSVLAVVAPSGLRVEGATVDEVIAIVRAVG
jgi:hypothetical protein